MVRIMRERESATRRAENLFEAAVASTRLKSVEWPKTEGGFTMDIFGNFIYMLDELLDSRRKRHIAGGILLSASMLFGGLALTVMTIKSDD